MRCLRILSLAMASLGLTCGVVAAEKARCPVQKVEFETSDKTQSVLVNGTKLSFCCAGCPKAFAASPEKFITNAGTCPVNANGAAKVAADTRVVLNNNLYYFCCANCPKAFSANPARFVKQLNDPVTGKAFTPRADSPRVVMNGQIYLFASAESKTAFEKEPARYLVIYKK